MGKIGSIDSVEIYIVQLPLVKPFETSFGVETHKQALLIKISSQDISGWGECVASPEPYYSYETNQTAYSIIKDFLVPLVESKRDFSPQDVLEPFKKIRGHEMAKAAVENALLDLLSKAVKLPLYNFLGGQLKKIMSGISIGIKDDLHELFEILQIASEKKYHRMKLKIKKGRDIEVLDAVRHKFPDIKIMVDANSDYTLEDMEVLKKLDDYNLMMIEQPLHYNDIYLHSLLQKELKSPICLDESIKNLEDVKTALALGSCKIINIKQGRVGGLLNSRAIADYCRKNQTKVWSGGMLETGIGRAFNLHLQTLPGFELPGDTSETLRYFKEDIIDKPVILDGDGYISVPDGTGIGVEVIPEKLKKFTTFYERLI